MEGVKVNYKRVERLFREAKLQVPRKKRVRIPASEQKSVVEQALYPHHIWCIDFQEDALLDGAKVKILNVLDEFTREWLFGRASLIKSAHWVKQTLRVLFEQGNTPASVRSDNGGEFIALTVKAFLLESGSESAFIEKGCPWENGIIESFHGKLRDEFLNRECFTTLAEFNIRLEAHRLWYNEKRPHSSLRYEPPHAFSQGWSSNNPDTSQNPDESPNHLEGDPLQEGEKSQGF